MHTRSPSIRALIEGEGHEVVYAATDEPNWKGVLDQPLDLIAIAGGDGTVTEVLIEISVGVT